METTNATSGSRLRVVLISVLVIVCLTVLFGASLMRILQRPGERERQRLCMSNLKQLWSASIMYAEENDGWMPVYTNSRGEPSRQETIGFRSPEKLHASLSKYVKNTSAWFCPSDRDAGTNKVEYHVCHLYSSYGFSFCKPGILRADGLLGKHPMPASKYGLIQDPTYEVSSGRLTFPHMGKGNVICLDGHTVVLTLQ